MSKLNNLSPRELHGKLKDAGWSVDDSTGSKHTMYSHAKYKHKVAVPRHTGFLRTGTLRSILKDANIREELNGFEKVICILENIKKKKQKIILNQNKTRVKIHPPLKEQYTDVLKPDELRRAVYFPEGILADNKASSQLKDYAFRVLQLRRGE